LSFDFQKPRPIASERNLGGGLLFLVDLPIQMPGHWHVLYKASLNFLE
jgi:hypothetical protein